MSKVNVLLNLELPVKFLPRVSAVSDRVRVVTAAQYRERPEWLDEASVLLTHHIDPAAVARARALRWIQTLGAGVEWLVTKELAEREDLAITNARGIHAQPIAEHVFGLILLFVRQLKSAVLQQATRDWNSAALRDSVGTLAGAELGILGFGAIGRRIAEIGSAFGMRVRALKRTAEPMPGVLRVYGPEGLREFLGAADFVVNALPLTQATRGLLGKDELSALRPNAVLINIGRGGTIDTDALVSLLREGRIGGAALDVVDPEPLPSDHPLWTLPNVILTPHYSGAHPGYLDEVAEIFLDNLRRYLDGRPLVNVVDKRAGY